MTTKYYMGNSWEEPSMSEMQSSVHMHVFWDRHVELSNAAYANLIQKAERAEKAEAELKVTQRAVESLKTENKILYAKLNTRELRLKRIIKFYEEYLGQLKNTYSVWSKEDHC